MKVFDMEFKLKISIISSCWLIVTFWSKKKVIGQISCKYCCVVSLLATNQELMHVPYTL